MSYVKLRLSEKATGRRPKVGNGEQRPRCDGGKVESSASGAERRGLFLFLSLTFNLSSLTCSKRSAASRSE